MNRADNSDIINLNNNINNNYNYIFDNNNHNNISALDTINAAATAIASAESRVPPPVHKRRWSNCFRIYWCFGSQKSSSKRIGHAILVPEPIPSQNGTTSTTTENATSPQPTIRIPFVAPPSSPASFLPSEPPSTIQSPAGSVCLNSISANMYSPGGPRSIFAIGPYAHETQLVTPPVFSTYTTEPSTAPYTPPPESVHYLTTPSSPEVPFAQLLDPGPRFPSSNYEFQTYLMHPGSPVGPLISPGSAVSGSGTSSPFPDRDFPGGLSYFPDIRYGVPQKLYTLEEGAYHEWRRSCRTSGSVTPDAFQPKSRDCILLDRQDSVITPLPNLPNGPRNNNEVLMDHRVSFELTSEDVVRCVEKKPTTLPRALQNSDERDDNATANTEEGQRYQKQRAASLGSIKEFNFDHANGVDSDDKPCVSSNWWANEKVVGHQDDASKNWSFFPMMQPGVS